MSVKTATWTAWVPPTGKAITGYKIFSNVDGEVANVGLVLTTPITLSDGVSHNVTCRAVYNDASLGLVSNVELVDLSSLFEDLFAGTTIDVAKWILTNPNSGAIPITQNNALLATSSQTTNTTARANNLRSLNAIDLSTFEVLTFDIICTNQNGSLWGIGLTKDVDLTSNINRIGFYKSNTVGDVSLIVKESGVNSLLTTGTLDISTAKTIKIVVNATDVTFYYWNGISWISLGTTAHSSVGNWYPVIWADDSTTLAINTITINNLKVVATDFATQRP